MSLLVTLLNGACSVVGAGSYEQPDYTVVEREDNFEIREYQPYLVAYTVTSGEYRDASSDGFRILADYIFGNNVSQTEMDMTSPVIQEKSQKMAMTAPVLQEQEGADWRMEFVIPAEYNLENVPQPVDKRVILEEIPRRTVAVNTFSWYTSEEKNATKETELREWIEKNGYQATGVVQSAQYDPPWTVPFMRRNEVLIEVAKSP